MAAEGNQAKVPPGMPVRSPSLVSDRWQTSLAVNRAKRCMASTGGSSPEGA